MLFCKDCQKPCEEKWYDQSLGSTEYLGHVSHHKGGCYVSTCCEAETIELSEDYDNLEDTYERNSSEEIEEG